MNRLSVFLLWCLHFLPQRALVGLGQALGMLLYLAVPMRRRVTLTNLTLCFPEKSAAERARMARRHFALYGRSLTERTVLWWGSPERIRRMVQVSGLAHLRAAGDRPVVLFSIHLVGMDVGWTRLSMEHDIAAMYARVRDPWLDRVILEKRLRFGQSTLVSNKEGVKAAIAVMKAGKPLMYLPDMDFGRKHSLFVPFFGVSAATIPGLARLARAGDALVVPAITRLTANGWELRLEAPWENFPGDSAEGDATRMNAYIEQVVREVPEQYWWTHQRFKTRPRGEPRLYPDPRRPRRRGPPRPVD